MTNNLIVLKARPSNLIMLVDVYNVQETLSNNCHSS